MEELLFLEKIAGLSTTMRLITHADLYNTIKFWNQIYLRGLMVDFMFLRTRATSIYLTKKQAKHAGNKSAFTAREYLSLIKIRIKLLVDSKTIWRASYLRSSQ